MEPVHLTAADCVFVMIDIQEKLVPALSGGEKAVFEASRLLRCAQEMKIPLITTEQYPKGLGPTVGPLRPFIDENALFAKTSFSCFDADGFAEKLSAQKRRSVVVFGAESHICLLTTAMDMIRRCYETVIVEDACGSRNPRHHELAMRNLLAAGAAVLPAETVVYQLLGRAGTPEFKALLPLFK